MSDAANLFDLQCSERKAAPKNDRLPETNNQFDSLDFIAYGGRERGWLHAN